MPFHRLPDDLYSLILKHAVNMSVEEYGPDEDEWWFSPDPLPMNHFNWTPVPDILHVLDGGIAARLLLACVPCYTGRVSDALRDLHAPQLWCDGCEQAYRRYLHRTECGEVEWRSMCDGCKRGDWKVE